MARVVCAWLVLIRMVGLTPQKLLVGGSSLISPQPSSRIMQVYPRYLFPPATASAHVQLATTLTVLIRIALHTKTHYHNFQYMPPVLQGPVIHPSVSKLHAVGTTTSGLSCRDNNKNLTKQNRSVRRVMSLPLKSNQNDYTANEVYASEDFSSSSLTTITSLSTYSDYEGGADEEEEYDVLDMFLRKATVPSSALVSTTTAIVTSSSTSTDDGFKSSNVNQQQKENRTRFYRVVCGACSTTQVIEGLLSRHESKRSSEIGLTSMSQVSAEFSPPILSEESESDSSRSAAGPGHRKVTSKASQLLNQTIAEDHCSEGSKAQQDGPSLNKKLSSFFNKFV